jgi:hypothetical protein
MKTPPLDSIDPQQAENHFTNTKQGNFILLYSGKFLKRHHHCQGSSRISCALSSFIEF